MSEMTAQKAKTNPALSSAMDAADSLCEDAFASLDQLSGLHAISAHSALKQRHSQEKSAAFYRSFLPLRAQMITVLANGYRMYFKLALAHRKQIGGDPSSWSWTELLPFVRAALEWMRDWYILACDGESQRVRTIATIEFVPGKTVSTPIPTSAIPIQPSTDWRAPTWLFGVSLSFFGIGVMKNEHMPNRDSEERLGPAHSRLLLKGAKRVFLWELEKAIDKVRNEEIAAAGAIPTETSRTQTDKRYKQTQSKRHLKGVKGLGSKKTDLSQYMHSLTEKQELAFSLKFEYQLGLAEIASRMQLDRKTAYEHIAAAKRKIDQVLANEKSRSRRANDKDE